MDIVNNNSTSRYPIRVLLACSEMEYFWYINEAAKQRVNNILKKIRYSSLSSSPEIMEGLYKGFLVNLKDYSVYVKGETIIEYSNGIITIRRDKSRKLEKYIYRISPKNKLPEILKMEIEKIHFANSFVCRDNRLKN